MFCWQRAVCWQYAAQEPLKLAARQGEGNAQGGAGRERVLVPQGGVFSKRQDVVPVLLVNCSVCPSMPRLFDDSNTSTSTYATPTRIMCHSSSTPRHSQCAHVPAIPGMLRYKAIT